MYAQDFPFKKFEHVGNQFGLINNYISDIVKDNKGRFWLGSPNGILAFDGFKTKLIKIPNSKNSIVMSNSISRLFLENDSILWIGQTYGVCYMNLKTNEIVPVPMYKKSKTQSLYFYFIFKDQSGDIWVSTREERLQRLNKKKFCFEKTGNISIDEKERVYDFQVIDSFRISFSHNKSISIYNTYSKKVELNKELTAPYSFLAENVFNGRISSSLIKGDKVYFERKLPGEVNYSFLVYELRTKDTIRHDVYSIAGRKFFEDSRGNIWIYNEGIAVIEKRSGMLYQTDTDDNYGFSLCNRIYEDNEHNLWFCTNFGLFVYNLDNIEINNFSEKEGGRPIGHIFTDMDLLRDSCLAFGTFDDGLLIFNKDFSFNKRVAFADHSDGSNMRINCLMKDDNDSSIIWLGGVFGKLIRYERVTGKYEFFFDDLSEKSSINWISQRKSKEILLATQNGRILSFNIYTKKFGLIYDQRTDKYMPMSYVNGAYLKGDTLLIISTANNGLHTYNLNTKVKKSYIMNPGMPGTIGSNVIYDVDEALNKILVSHESGIDEFDIKAEKFKRLIKEQEAPFSACYSFVQISSNEIAINTSDGLYRINLENSLYYRIGKGTQLDKSNYWMKYLKGRKTFVFASDSYLYYSMDKNLRSGTKPNCFLYSIESKDTVLNFDLVNGPVKLSRYQNTIRITLGSNTFTNKAYIDYWYKIEGETEWVNVRENREILFNNLQGGSYTIKVKCLNRESNIFSDEVILQLSITKAFYETIWFYILIFIIVSIVIYAIYRVRINRLLEIERVRFKLSRDLHDDMGSTLSTINILSQIAIKNVNKGDEKISEYLDRISDYSQDMMDAMNDIVWSINPLNDNMSKVSSRMREFATNILEPKGVRLTFNYDKNIEQYNLRMENRKEFFLIFKEAINNAAKHSNSTAITVNLGVKNNKLILGIIDNGIGFNVNDIKANGLLNMKYRANLIQGELLLESIPGTGTNIILSLPIE